MFSGQSDTQLQVSIEKHIQHYYASESEYQELTLDSEYQILIGKEYDELRKQHGGISTRKESLRQADFKVAQTLYIYGQDKQKVIDALLRRSPALSGMKQGDRKKYAKDILKAMNKVEPKRQKKQQQKQAYSMQTNCKRDIENYLKCMKAEKQARAQGVMISHLNYRQFQKEKSNDFHKGYIAKIEKRIAEQQKVDRERQQKQEQQMQRQIQRQRSI